MNHLETDVKMSRRGDETVRSARSVLSQLKYVVIWATLFLIPLFFLPITQEFYVTQKFYLLGFASGLLLLISTLEFAVSKKIVWKKSRLDNASMLFLLAVLLSIIISSPNKMEALFNPNFGFVQVLSLTVFSYYLSREFDAKKILETLSFSAWVVALCAIIFFFQPLKNINLPLYLQFLKARLFNPVGGVIDVGVFLGFFTVYGLSRFSKKEKGNGFADKGYIIASISLLLTLSALLLVGYSVVKLHTPQAKLILPPYSVSWYAAVEVLKKPLTAVFGVGVDNFSSIFSYVKDFAYNQSKLWNVSSFSLSRSAVLHVLTETGLLGFIGFTMMIVKLWSIVKRKRNSVEFWLFIYTVLVLTLLPPSLISLFLFFVLVAVIARQSLEDASSTDISNFMPVYVITIILGIGAVGVLYYFLGKSYIAKVYFKRGLNGISKNNIKILYDNGRKAVLLAPYDERFRVNFSQTNLLIANNISRKIRVESKGKKPKKLSARDRQTITQAIQAAIAEAKAVVALNPQKASNWANLANIYRNVLNVAQGADVWTISAYQRAIVNDPQNPVYRLNLGAVYFALQKYDEAINLFRQAVSIKPNWSNAHYNLAWAYYRNKNYQNAVSEMQTTLSLLNPKKAGADYDKAKKDLEEFKKMLPKKAKPAKKTSKAKPKELSIPTPPVATISPKIKLPKDAQPSTK